MGIGVHIVYHQSVISKKIGGHQTQDDAERQANDKEIPETVLAGTVDQQISLVSYGGKVAAIGSEHKQTKKGDDLHIQRWCKSNNDRSKDHSRGVVVNN